MQLLVLALLCCDHALPDCAGQPSARIVLGLQHAWWARTMQLFLHPSATPYDMLHHVTRVFIAAIVVTVDCACLDSETSHQSTARTIHQSSR